MSHAPKTVTNTNGHQRGSARAREFTMHAMRAHLLALAGRHAKARHSLDRAEQVRRGLPADVSLDSHWLRLHWRNAALLCDRDTDLWRKARRFHETAARRGLQAHAPA